MRRHLLTGAAIDDQRLGTHALGGAGDVDGRVAAAIDDDAAAEQRLVLALHAAQQRDGIDDLRRVTGGNHRPLADVCADSEEGSVEAAFLHGFEDVVDLAAELDLDPEVNDPLHLGFEHVARQAVLGNAEAHHAAEQRPRFLDRDLMAEAAQVVGGRHSRRAGADDQNVLARFAGRRGQLPAALERLVAEEALDRIDPHRRIKLAAVAGALAGVVADPPHDRRERVVLGQVPPGAFIVARFGVEQPALDVLAGRALLVARWQPVEIDRPRGAPGAGTVGQR
ncbi:MAG: hypothetical protein AW07_02071 [Candidatus Accumulibacter sp. SK-11]|nr:MAG: hypothetical protein AW07_02071 [Candidatus Accumulibacter sp. SK-11]